MSKDLIDAAKRGKLDVVQSLLGQGADVDGTDNKGKTALMEASRTGKADVVQALLGAGAATDLQDKDGWTAAMRAIMARQSDTLDLLVAGGANLQLQNNKGEDAFQIALGYGTANMRPAILSTLAKGGVDPNARQVKGKPALIYAVTSLQSKAVGGLVKAGADPNVKDDKGRPAIVLAADNSTLDQGVEAVAHLVAGGADLNARDAKGRSALEYAVDISKMDYKKQSAKNNAAKVAYILASRGADYQSTTAARAVALDKGYSMLFQLIVKGERQAQQSQSAQGRPASSPAAHRSTGPSPDAPKFAGSWKSDEGQLTKYVYEGGTLYVLFGSEKNECTLEGGRISYRAGGMNQRMNYRFLDDDTLEYTAPSMPNWKMIQRRQP